MGSRGFGEESSKGCDPPSDGGGMISRKQYTRDPVFFLYFLTMAWLYDV
jgi:hypothetical protein